MSTQTPGMGLSEAIEDVFRAWFEGKKHWVHGVLPSVPDLSELRGKDVACWCKIGEKCHADILLELANS